MPPLNPYAAPLTEIGLTPIDIEGNPAAAEILRRTYHRREVAVKVLGVVMTSLGCFFLVLGLILSVVSLVIGMSVEFTTSARGADEWVTPLVLGTVQLFFGTILFAAGLGLRRLKPWARWFSVVITTLVLLVLVLLAGLMPFRGGGGIGAIVTVALASIPLGTLVLLMSPDATILFSPGYKSVIARTSPRFLAKSPPRKPELTEEVRRNIDQRTLRWIKVAIFGAFLALLMILLLVAASSVWLL